MARLLERTESVYNSIIRKFESSGLSADDFMFSLDVSPATLRLIYYVLKKYCNERNIEFNIDIKDLPKEAVSLQNINNTKIGKDEIIKMIHEVKKSKYDASKCFMALSTVYGTRCIELSRILPEDIDINKKLILIKTAKSGEPRIHKIPDEIIKYITNFKPIASQIDLWRIFHKSFKIAGIDSKDEGYHSIRKVLFTELINNGARYEFAEYFLRWKLGGRVSFSHYFIPETDRVADEIFKYHPFIKEWA